MSVALLSLLYAVSGALCLAGARFPVADDAPVVLVWTVGCCGLAAAAVIRVLGRRWPRAVTHTGSAVMGALVALLASQSVTPVGVVGLGPVLITCGLYAAHAFGQTGARVQVAALVAGASAAAVAAEPTGFVVPWLVVVVATVGTSEAQGQLSRRLRAAATTDPLTGVANRRAWEERTAAALARTARAGRPLTVAILDLDDFKEVNDAHGYAAGDTLLRDLVRSWGAHLRGHDLLGRYGGDEFVLTLPGTDEPGARELLARLAGSHRAPWSVGVATTHEAEPLGQLLARADAALYRGKRSRASTRLAGASLAAGPLLGDAGRVQLGGGSR